MTMTLIIIGLLFLAGFAYIWIMDRIEARARENRNRQLQTRPVLSREVWLGLLSANESIDEDFALEIAARFAKHYDCRATQLLPDDRFDEALGLNCPTAFGLNGDDEHDLFLDIDIPEMLGAEGTKMFEAQDSTFNTLGELIIEIQRIKQNIVSY